MSMDERGATRPSQTSGTPWGWGALAAVVVGLLTFGAGLAGMAVGIQSAEAGSELSSVTRTAAAAIAVLVLLVLAITLYLAVRLVGLGTRGFWLGVAIVAYLLNPWSWGGAAVATRMLVTTAEPGLGMIIVGWVLDLVVWLAVAYLVVGIAWRHGPFRDVEGSQLR